MSRFSGSFLFTLLISISILSTLFLIISQPHRRKWLTIPPISWGDEKLFASPKDMILPFERFTIPNDITTDRTFRSSPRKMRRFHHLFIDEHLLRRKMVLEKCKINGKFASRQPLLIFRGSFRNYGIGDRVRSLLNVFLIAAITDRLLLIDLERPFPIKTVWTSPGDSELLYNADLFPVDQESADVLVVKKKKMQHTLKEYQTDVRVIIHEGQEPFLPGEILNWAKHFPAFRKRMQEYGIGEFVPKRNELAPLILKSVIEPTEILRYEIRKQLPFPDSTPYFSVHARLGTGLNENGMRFNTSAHGFSIEDSAFCIGRVAALEARQRGLSSVFVSTDTRNMGKMFEAGVMSTIPTATVRVSKGNAKHLRTMTNKESHLEDFITSFVDIALLARGKGIVYFMSGFADVSMWLGGILDGRQMDLSDCVGILEACSGSSRWNRTCKGSFHLPVESREHNQLKTH